MNACNYCGRFIAYILGGIVAQAISNLAPFLLTFGVGLLGFIISLFIKDIHVVKEPLKTADLLKVAGDKRLWAFALLATVIQYISFSTYYAFSNDMAKALGASDFSLGTMSAVLTVPLMFGSFFSGGKILKKCGAKAVVVATVGCMTAYCFILPFVPNMFWFYVMQVVGGIGYGFCLSIVMGLGIQHIASEKRSTAMGLFQSIYSIGMTIGPMITGVFKQQFNMTVAFLSVGVIGVLGCHLDIGDCTRQSLG